MEIIILFVIAFFTAIIVLYSIKYKCEKSELHSKYRYEVAPENKRVKPINAILFFVVLFIAMFLEYFIEKFF
jgi:hypothetical protein